MLQQWSLSLSLYRVGVDMSKYARVCGQAQWKAAQPLNCEMWKVPLAHCWWVQSRPNALSPAWLDCYAPIWTCQIGKVLQEIETSNGLTSSPTASFSCQNHSVKCICICVMVAVSFLSTGCCIVSGLSEQLATTSRALWQLVLIQLGLLSHS